MYTTCPNQTAQDAYRRVLDARLGSLANNPTSEYLEALRQCLYQFLAEVEERQHTLLQDSEPLEPTNGSGFYDDEEA